MNHNEVVEDDTSAVDSKRAYRIHDWGLRVIPQDLSILTHLQTLPDGLLDPDTASVRKGVAPALLAWSREFA